MPPNINVSGKLIKQEPVSSDSNSYKKSVISFFEEISQITLFTVRFFKEVFRPPYEFKELVKQGYLIGYKSFPLIAITGFIMGLVLTIQSRPTLAEFGAESWLPAMVAVSIVREIGPVITALIFAGKVGSSIGAELASMKVTEQIDAMEVSGTNPFKFLVVTRITAITLMLPILVIYTGLIGMLGAFINIHQNELTSFPAFISSAFKTISFLDIFSSIFKAICYGFTIGVAACYQGYNAQNGTKGVGNAANVAVVLSMFMIFIEEMVIVQFVNAIR